MQFDDYITTGTGGRPSRRNARRGRARLSSKAKSFILSIPVSSDDNSWCHIDIPIAVNGTRTNPRSFQKALCNYRRDRADYKATNIETAIVEEDAPAGHCRIWVRIYPKEAI